MDKVEFFIPRIKNKHRLKSGPGITMRACHQKMKKFKQLEANQKAMVD
jgi:hypothetical protein